MLGVLLAVLKIIGLILLWLLAIILGLVLLILFVPIGYSFRGRAEEMSVDARAKVTVLGIIGLNVLAHIEPKEKLDIKVLIKLLFIPVFSKPSGKKKKSKDRNEQKEQIQEDISKDGQVNEEADSEISKQSEITKQCEITEQKTERSVPVEALVKTEENTEENTDITDIVDNTDKIDTDEDADHAKHTEQSVKADQLDKTEQSDKANQSDKTEQSDKADQSGKTDSDIFDKIEGILDKKEKIEDKIDMLRSDASCKAYQKLWNAVVVILKSIRPRKFTADLVLGTGDCESTGKVYGMYCSLIFPKYNKTVKLEPEFDEKRLDGEIYLRGHILLIVLAVQGLKVFFDKDIRKLIRNIKK